jgi:hypothetical protein
LKGRVASILNPEQPRKLLSKRRLAGLLTMTGVFFGSLSALALGQTKDQGAMADVQVRNPIPGKTIPATPANGYKAKLSDGRILEVLQVTQFDPNGKAESWLPDGRPIPAGKEVKVPPVKGRHWIKAMLIRYPLLPRASAMDLSFRVLEGPGGAYKYLNFSGGKLLPPKDGYRYGICYFGLPSPAAELSFTIGIDDATQQIALSWKPDGSTRTHIPGAQDFKIDEVDSSTIGGERFWLRDYKGPVIRISWTNTFGSDWLVTDNFQLPPRSRDDLDIPYMYSEGQERVTYVKRPKADLKGFSLVITPRFTCEVQQVKMRPNR